MDEYKTYEDFAQAIKDDNIIIETFGMGDLICNSHIRRKGCRETPKTRDYGAENKLPLSYVTVGMNFLMCDRFVEVFSRAFPDCHRDIMDHVRKAADYTRLKAFRGACLKRAKETFLASAPDYPKFQNLMQRAKEFFRDPAAVAFVDSNGSFTEAMKQVSATYARDNYFIVSAVNIREPERRAETGMDSALVLDLSLRLDEQTVLNTGMGHITCTLRDFEQPHILMEKLTLIQRPEKPEPQMRM